MLQIYVRHADPRHMVQVLLASFGQVTKFSVHRGVALS